MATERIYLDHAATTPLRAEAQAAMEAHAHDANPSSIHAEGRRARAALEEARATVAAILRCRPKEIVFCGSGTEADNLAVIGTARAARSRGKHVVATAIEHHAVLRALDVLRQEGFEVTLIPVNARGVIERDAFAAALRAETVVAAMMYANNEIGTIQPVAQCAALARERGILFVTDAVQAAGALDLDVAKLGVDALAISAHKFAGPKGAGALYVREGTPLEPIVYGGGQERGRRSGTEDVAGAVGLARAFQLAEAEREMHVTRLAAMRDRFEDAMARTIPGVIVNGQGAARLPGISSVSFPGLEAEPLLIALDLAGIAASAGSACTTGALEPSHVIAALGLPPATVKGTLRFSLGRTTTVAETASVAARLRAIVAAQREGAALSV